MSPTARAAILLLVGALLGGGIRLAIPSGRDGRSPGRLSSAPEPAREPPVEIAAEPAAASSAEPEPAAEIGALSAELERQLAGLATPALDDDLVLEGVVRGEGEIPLAGILIRIAPIGVPYGHSDTTENIQARNLEKYVVDRTAEHRFRHGGGRETRSDERGRFRFEELAAAAYSIEAPVEGRQVTCRAGGAVRAWAYPGEEVVIEVIRTVVVPVAVRYPGGSSPATADILVDDGRGRNTVKWSSDRPELTLPEGRHRLTANLDGWASTTAVASALSDRVEPVVLELARRGGIALSIAMPEGEGSGLIHVRYLALASEEDATAERLLSHGSDQSFWNPSGEDGRVEHRIEPLPPAEYAIGIGRNSDTIDALAVATVSDGIAEISLELPAVADEEAIEVRALDPEGNPIESFSCSLRWVTSEGEESIGHAMVRRADGVVQLLPDAEARERILGSGGELWVEASAAKQANARARVEGGRATVRFAPVATVIVQASGWEEMWAGATLSFFDESGRQVHGGSIEGPESTIGTIGAGEYTAELGFQGDLPAEPFRVRLVEGENIIPVELPPTYTLEVECPEALAGYEWSIQRTSGLLGRSGWYGARHGERAEGITRFDGLFAGEYALFVVREAEMLAEVMRIDVDRDARIRFEGAPVRAALLRMREDRRPGDLAVQDGDIIIGANGREFASSTELMQGMMLLEEVPDGTLLIDRAGEGRITLPIPPGGMQYFFQRGIQIVPVARE